jgi:hypothetical protein
MSQDSSDTYIEARISARTLNPPAITLYVQSQPYSHSVLISPEFAVQSFRSKSETEIQLLQQQNDHLVLKLEQLNAENIALKSLIYVFEAHQEPEIDLDEEFARVSSLGLGVSRRIESIGIVKSSPFDIDFED